MKRPRLKRPSLRRSGKKKSGTAKSKPARKPSGRRNPIRALRERRAKRAAAKPSKAAAKPSKAAAGSKAKAEKKKAAQKKESSRDVWFRVSTRVRAIGYWVREKAQQAWRALRRAAEWVADLWLKRSKQTRIRIAAVAGVLLLYSVVKFAPVPGVPCTISAYRECAVPNDSIEQVPADALLYSQLTLDEDTAQFKRADDLAEQLPDIALVTQQLTSALPTPSGAPVEIARDVLPWADREIAFALLPQPQGVNTPLFIVGVGDKAGAEQFLTKIAPPGAPQAQTQGKAPLSVYAGGFASAFVGDSLLFGSEVAVRASLDAGPGEAKSLEDAEPADVRDELPEAHFAELYLSRAGVQRLLAQSQTGGTQLETFIDYAATSSVAAAAVARDDGVEIALASELDPKLAEKSPSFFSGLPKFEPNLTEEAGERALAYVGVGEIGPTVTELLERAGGNALVASLQGLATRLQAEAGVDPLKQLLPALGGQAALVAEPTDGVPFASLIVEDVDEGIATEAFARLQGPLLRSIAAPGGQVPRFEESEVEGVQVRSVQVSATVNLSYAIFDGLLVISTDPAGIAQVKSDGDSLADSGAYDRATNDLPGDVSALVFLNLEELLGLAEQAGLAEDPLYASLSDDISQIGSLGLAVTASDDLIETEMFLAID